MPGDNFGDNNFLWGQNLLNAVSSYVLLGKRWRALLTHNEVDLYLNHASTIWRREFLLPGISSVKTADTQPRPDGHLGTEAVVDRMYRELTVPLREPLQEMALFF
jgi:hypothetical protein